MSAGIPHVNKSSKCRTGKSSVAKPAAEKEKSYFSFIALMAVFVLLLAARDIMGVSVSKYVFIGVAVLIFMVSDLSGILAFLAFVTPISLGVSYTFMTFLAIIFIIVKSERIDIGIAIVFPFLIIFLELVNSFVSPIDTFPEFLRSVVMIGLLALLFLDSKKTYNYKMCIYMFLFGYLVLVFFTLFWVTETGSIQEYLRTGTTLAFGFLEGVEGNKIFAASYAMGLYSVMTIAVALLLLYAKKGSRVFLLSLTVLAFIMGFVSTSRSFMFSAVICVFLFMLFSAKGTKGTARVIFVTLILIIIALLLVNTLLSQQYSTFVEKMQMSDVSNGRFDLLRYYNNVFLSSPKIFFIGVGLQNYVIKCGSYWNSIHNATQEALLAWGVIGFACVVGFFTTMYKNAVRLVPKQDRDLMYTVPALVFLFYMQFHQLFSVRSTTMMLIVVYCTLALNGQLMSERKEDKGSEEFPERSCEP